jgi:NAD(P)-dependent dehydrogenase (short-subunit alcohol dehydrogenase family)
MSPPGLARAPGDRLANHERMASARGVSGGGGAARVALVSGANRGIGLATVDGLAMAGMNVVLGSRDPAGGEAARASLDADRAAVSVRQLDVTDPSSVRSCIESVEAQFGRLDVLVNNAGILLDRGGRASEPDLDVVRETLEVNVYGAWRLTLAALPLMRSTGGRIINLSSGLGQLTDMGGGIPGYRLSKVSLNALTRMLAAELGEAFSVNSVCPGWVRTDMGGSGAARSPEEGADTIVWLATLPDSEVPTGGFFRDRRQIPW